MPPRSRDLIYLRAYLQERSRHPFAHRDWPWGMIVPLGLIGVVFATVTLAREVPAWMLVLLIPFAIAALATTATRVSWALQQPRNESESKEMAAYETARFLGTSLGRRQLHPFAARLLEGCAYHRARILAAVSGAGWEQGHLRSVRDQAIAAADDAMREAMTVCAHFAGPGHSAGAAWKDLAQDFAEGQIGDALKRLQSMLEADRPGEIVDRRKLPAELWPVYEIAVKLQRLASELESTSHRAPEFRETSVDSLDQVLADLAEIREAERELEEEPRLRQL